MRGLTAICFAVATLFAAPAFADKDADAYYKEGLAYKQEGKVDEALRVALRIIEERAELVHRMADDGRHSGRAAVAQMYDARAAEYREYADMIRRAVLHSLEPKTPKLES